MKKGVLFAISFLFILAVSSAWAQNLTWTAGNVGGGWYTIGGGIANIINEKSGGITVKSSRVGASRIRASWTRENMNWDGACPS